MNTGKNLTLMQKIRLKQEKDLYTKKVRLRKVKRNRRIAIIVLAILTTVFIYAMNLLFNNNTKSHALEISTTVSKSTTVKKNVKTKITNEEIKVPKKEIKVTNVSAPEVIKKVETPHTNGFVYNEQIPMPKDHQEYLYKLCKERGLNYLKTLAVIKHESGFNANIVNQTHDYGYFQVNLANHQALAQQLHTENSPLNPYININWGTSILSNLYSYWGEKGFNGERLDEVVWSSYNKGIAGFRNTGHATEYIYKMKHAIQEINEDF